MIVYFPGIPLHLLDMEPTTNDTIKKAKNYATKKARKTCTLQAFLSWFPIIGFLKNYDLECLSGDFVAGITCALTVIPQGIGYASLAGLPLQVPYLIFYI